MARIAGKFLLFSTIAAFSWHAFAATDETGATVKWGYVGHQSPAYWAQLNPAFTLCSKGKRQSPINIPKKMKHAESKLVIDYQPATLRIIEDGTTSLLLGDVQTIIRDGHGLQVNYNAKDGKELVSFAGNDYRLVQFHFHTPSENEWRKRSFSGEIHFVHQGADGKALVVAVFIKTGASNAALQTLIDHLPDDQGQEHVISSEQFSPDSLLPAKHNEYAIFDGSLTTPPCAEGVQWVVMADTITASPAQIVTLRKAMGGANARPVQPLNKRKILYVKGKS